MENSGEGRIPDFFLVGHTKCGTTAMYEMLSQHPQVFVGLKEPRYFAPELYERDLPRPGGTPKTLEQYKAWFARAAPDQLVGDISPIYLWSQSAAGLIAEAAPEAKIIAVLREPASFLHSLHRQWLQINVESEHDFATALALEQERREGRGMPRDTFWPKAIFYSEHVRYVEQLRRYEKRFPAERILVLIYEDFRADNAGTLRRVLRFLEVDEELRVGPRTANTSVQVRSPRLHALMRRLIVARGPGSRAAKSLMKAVVPVRARQRTLQVTRRRFVYGEPTPPPAELMLELRRRMKPEVAALSEHLGRDLVALWGYEGL